jgi:hypothetical protein
LAQVVRVLVLQMVQMAWLLFFHLLRLLVEEKEHTYPIRVAQAALVVAVAVLVREVLRQHHHLDKALLGQRVQVEQAHMAVAVAVVLGQ